MTIREIVITDGKIYQNIPQEELRAKRLYMRRMIPKLNKKIANLQQRKQEIIIELYEVNNIFFELTGEPINPSDPEPDPIVEQ